MGRKVLAILAFNVYALILISAFQENTVHLFDASLVREMTLSGFDVNPQEWGWGNHYIWRLFAGVVVTALAGFLTGAVSKEKGAKIAALANIPSVMIWGGTIYVLGFANGDIEARTGFLVISIIAIPLTTYIAYLSGGLGEEIQRQEFPDNTVLGIKGYHWVWAIIPLYWYSLGIIFVAAKYLGFQLATWSDPGIIAALLSLFMLVPIVAWVYPLRIVHRVLMGELLSNYNAAISGLANFGVLIVGMIFAVVIQFGVYWLLDMLT